MTLVPGSDGLPVRVVGAWSEEKLFYLQRYINIFTTAMREKWDRLVYVDVFCGPGRSQIQNTDREILGSPLIALAAPFPFSELYFSDLDPEVIQALSERLRRTGAENAAVKVLDCTTAAADAGRLLFRPGSRTLGLAFVDPTAFQIGLDALHELTTGRSIDIVMTVMTGFMRRFAKEASFGAPLDHYFGSSSWRSLVAADASEPVTTRALLDHYENRLRELGYVDFNDDVRIVNSVQSTIYHMVFASKNKLGGDFWKKITRRGPSGQARLDL